MINKIIPLWLRERSYQTIWLLISFLIGACWLLPETNILIQAIAQLLTPILVKITLTLFLLGTGFTASLGVFYREYKRKPNPKDYEIINPPGFMRHKITGGYFCHPCLIQRHTASELSTISTKEFVCRICKESYKIDYSVLICDKYLSMVHDRAADELIHKKENV